MTTIGVMGSDPLPSYTVCGALDGGSHGDFKEMCRL